MASKSDIIQKLSEKSNITKTQAQSIFNDTLEIFSEVLKSGDDIVLIGFGTFHVVTSPAAEKRNPRTGEKIKVPARKALKFRAGATIKNELNNR